MSNDARLAPIVAIHRELLEEKERLDARIEELGEHIKRIETETIPAVMDELGLLKVKLSDKTEIRLTTTCIASVTDQEKAFAFLREHNFGGIIRNNFNVEMGVTEDERAQALAAMLAEGGFDFTNDQKIHPMTLKSWANERISKNEVVPPDAFSITPVTRAIIKRKM